MQTPAYRDNAAGLAAIAYRAGTWSSFKESMLARLSSADYPALAPLKTRSDDDFVPAILDAAAMMLDVLTFYQERLANEGYLRTATQQRSLTELSRLIGYQPAPGVAASTYLAFSFKPTPGQPPPDPSAPPITIPQGTQVQSVPAQGQSPQTFETSADIAAKPDWSALQVQTGNAWSPHKSSEIHLSGTTTQLQPGDSLLILGAERENWIPGASTARPPEQWDVVVVNTVTADKIRNLTRVTWNGRLDHTPTASSDFKKNSTARVFAFRQKAALFGHNAPAPHLFVRQPASVPPVPSLPFLIEHLGAFWVWRNFEIPFTGPISLDSTYQKIVSQSWFALTTESEGRYRALLLKVEQVNSASLAEFAMSAKVTQLTPDYQNYTHFSAQFGLRETEVWAQSDELQVAEQPLPYPLYGSVVALETRRTDLAAVNAIALAGTRQKISVKYKLSKPLRFTSADGDVRNLEAGEILTVLAPPDLPTNGELPDWSTSKHSLTLNVADASGAAGTVAAELVNFTLVPADASNPVVGEFALVTGVDATSDPAHTQLQLSAPLANCYDRATTTVNTNVGLATQGQSVSEVLGSGAASTPNQTFTLKQSPLTYIQAATTPTGRSSTLAVQVNGVDWTLVPTLSGQSGSSNVYATLDQPGGATTVLFGDGIEGALLPTGQNNVQASYRIGSGAAGNVGAATLTTLVDRPLGVSGVVNPQAATGGQDAETVDDTRTNAPRTVLTLGRAVSITDYQNFASSFAGIAKAHALWIPVGPGYGVFITIAGAGGTVLLPGDPTFAHLTGALHAYGNPLMPITAVGYIQTLFNFSADLAYDPAYDAPTVEAAVRTTLADAFGFAARTFGQSVGRDEIAAVIQGVPGIVAVNVTGLWRGASTGGIPASPPSKPSTKVALLSEFVLALAKSSNRLYASLPVPDPQTLPQPAEILVIDPVAADVTLSPMT